MAKHPAYRADTSKFAKNLLLFSFLFFGISLSKQVASKVKLFGAPENPKLACGQIFRSLKKHSTAVIPGLAHCNEYLTVCLKSGLSAERIPLFIPFQPLTIIEAVRN